MKQKFFKVHFVIFVSYTSILFLNSRTNYQDLFSNPEKKRKSIDENRPISTWRYNRTRIARCAVMSSQWPLTPLALELAPPSTSPFDRKDSRKYIALTYIHVHHVLRSRRTVLTGGFWESSDDPSIWQPSRFSFSSIARHHPPPFVSSKTRNRLLWKGELSEIKEICAK